MKIIAPAAVVVGLLLLSATHAAGTRYWYSGCSVSAGNYTPGSRYEQNIKLLFASVPKKVSSSPALFARDAAGLSKEEVAYAAAQCRGDTNSSTCNRCVTEALQDAQMACPFSKDATIFNELCTVQFSNKMLSWTSNVRIAVKGDGFYAIKQRKGFELGVDTLITAVTSLAANSPQRYATALQEVDDNGTKYNTYGLVQCVPEMTPAECGTCLKTLLVPYAFPGLMGGRKALLWCSYRYESYDFFFGDPQLRLPTFTYNPPKRHTLKRKTILVLVAVGVSVLVLILALLTIFFCWRKQKKRSGEVRNKSIETVERGFPEAHNVKCPSAIMCFDEITSMTQGKKILNFLDYDGTISPIVKNPDMAIMPPEIREAVQKAAQLFPTSIVSGRCIEKVKDFVKLDDLHYAGSHGMEIMLSGELEPSYTPIEHYKQIIAAATDYLEEASRKIVGARVENNKLVVSVHYRNVDEKDWPLVHKLVADAQEAFEGLRTTRGHMVLELRPLTGLNKGTAVNYLINHIVGKLGLDNSELLPIYFGDDVTDEDAFEVLRDQQLGFGVLISQEPRTSKALYSLKDPFEVMDFLNELVRWRKATVEDDDDEIVETSCRYFWEIAIFSAYRLPDTSRSSIPQSAHTCHSG